MEITRCGICLEAAQLRGGGRVLYSAGCCGAWFHQRCINAMKSSSNAESRMQEIVDCCCPMCRAPLPKEEEDEQKEEENWMLENRIMGNGMRSGMWLMGIEIRAGLVNAVRRSLSHASLPPLPYRPQQLIALPPTPLPPPRQLAIIRQALTLRQRVPRPLAIPSRSHTVGSSSRGGHVRGGNSRSFGQPN